MVTTQVCSIWKVALQDQTWGCGRSGSALFELSVPDVIIVDATDDFSMPCVSLLPSHLGTVQGLGGPT